MFTRRIATVIMLAPLASVANRVSSKSLYLPLPTNKREPYVIPAMVRPSLAA